MRYEDHRFFLLDKQLCQFFLQTFAGKVIERAKRLIHKNHVRVKAQGSSQGYTLSHSAGKLRRIERLESRQAQHVDMPIDPFIPFCLHQRPIQAKRHVFANREPGHQPVLLKHNSHPVVMTGWRRSGKNNFTGSLLFQSGDQSQQRGLATTAFPDDHNKTSIRHGDGNLLQCKEIFSSHKIFFTERNHINPGQSSHPPFPSRGSAAGSTGKSSSQLRSPMCQS